MPQLDLQAVGSRIRRQREALDYTRETFAEKLGVTPKFCADIELGLKGMSVQTLCRVSSCLHLSTDYILYGSEPDGRLAPIIAMLRQCRGDQLSYAEELLRLFLNALEEGAHKS